MTKKRLVKKVVAFVATAMMLVGMVIPAMASGVTYADKGTITVHKYAGNQEGIIPNHTGAELNAADANHPLNKGYTALPGAEFTLYKVTSLDGVMAKLKEGKTITSTEVITGVTPSVKYVFSDGTDVVAGTGEISVVATGVDGKAVFGNSNLVDGVYVLVETKTPEGYKTAAPSVIRLPLTDAAGKYNYNVHVYPKNVSNTDLVKKDIAGVSKPISTGDIINFELKAKFITDTVTSVGDLKNGAVYGTAKITEEFSPYFNVEETPGVKAYWLKADGTIDTAAEISGSHIAIDALPAGDGGTFSATLRNAGIDYAIAQNKVGFGLTLSAKYVGQASSAAGDSAARITNTMYALIKKAGEPVTPGDPGTKDETYAPSISIKVDKNQSNGSALAGVTFAVAKVAVPKVNIEPGKALSTYSAADITNIQAEYVLDAAGEPLVAVTDANGFVLFSNLNGYNNASGATFYLKELATVAGYKLRVPAIEVNFKTQAQYKTAHADWFDASNNWKENANVTEVATVVNYKLDEPGGGEEPGFSLPLTGGAGTVAFTVAGILVMLGAALLIVRKKKVA